MKKFVTGCVLALALNPNLYAAGNDRLIDLMYMPEAGHLVLTPKLTYSAPSYDIKNSSGSSTPITETSNTHMDLDLNMEFGLMEGFSLGGDLGYRVSDETETKVNATGQKTKVSEPGVKDVNFFGRYRLFTQDDMGFDLDLGLNVSPGLANTKTPTTTKDGNAFRGGTQFGLSGDVRLKLDAMTLVGGLNATMTGTRTVEDATTGVETHEWDSSTDITVSGDIQFGIGESMALDLGADVILAGSTSKKTKATGAKVEYDSHTDFVFGGNFRFLLDENMAFGGGLDYKIGGDYSQKSSTTNYTVANNTEMIASFFFSMQL